MKLHRASIAFLLLALSTAPLFAQTVTLHPEPSQPLEARWTWAEDAARSRCADGCWIGYSVERLMSRDSWIGNFDSGNAARRTLQEAIYGVAPDPSELPRRGGSRSGSGSSEKVLKDIALLFRYGPDGGQTRDLHVTNMTLPARLENLPVLWLGPAEQPQSLAWLRQRFNSTASSGVKKDLVVAVAMHDATDLVVPFLGQILTGRDDDEVRAQAAFWIGQQDHPSGLPMLERAARQDRSEEVRKQAVFAVSQMELEAATDLLIDLARHAEDGDTRHEAVFWLGQRASQKAVEGLDDLAHNDPDTEIQKKAVFALSQLSDGQGVPSMISIARTHRNPNVRKEAIFWLGQTQDPRAVDVLVDIVRGE